MSFLEQLSDYEGLALLLPDDMNTSGAKITYPQLLAQAEAINLQLGTEKQLIFIQSGQNLATIYAIVAMLVGKHCAMLLPEKLSSIDLDKLIVAYQPNYLLRTDSTTDSTAEQENWNLQPLSKKQLKIQVDLCLMLSTSGSTGTPKQVMLSTGNLFANARSIVHYLHITQSERAITSLPLSYSYGLSILTTHLLAGASLFVSNSSIMSRDFWQQLEGFNITSLAGVPYTYSMLKKLKIDQKKLPELHTLTQAGGKLAADLVAFFAKYTAQQGKQFFVMYGQTEATARMSYLKPEDVLIYPESIGNAIPDGQFILLDEKKLEIKEANQAGELVYYGPNVMMGYALNADDLSNPPTLTCLETGDLAYRDAQGNYYISGRKSRFIKIFGQRINLDELEALLNKHKFKVICSGMDDKLLVVSEFNYSTDRLLALLQKQLQIHHSAITIKIESKIPYNHNGKIDYQSLIKESCLS